MFGWGQAQAQGQQPVQQRGRRVRQQPGRGGQAAPNVEWRAPERYDYADQTTISRAAHGRMNALLDERIRQRRTLSYSDRLRMSLEVDGNVYDREGDPQTQAHHIVETSNREGQNILRRYGIASDAAINGVLLPTEQEEDGPDTTLHLGSHRRDYRDCVNEALTAAENGAIRGGKDPARAVAKRLTEIRRVLLTRVVPLNNRVDGDYNDATDDEMTIWDIFSEEGLFDWPQ